MLYFVFGKWETIRLIVYSYSIIIFLGFICFWKVAVLGSIQFATLGVWIKSGLFVVNWGFIFDSLSVSMLLMVSLVSGAVHYYSLGYMETDPSVCRFISYLSLFTFFMFILVSGDNFIQLFLGWEGIGLCSYLLISFWNTRIQANKASLKALILNRVGDFGLLCGIVLIFYFFRTVDFSIVFVLAPFFSEVIFSLLGFDFFCLDAICFFLFIGCIGKSAQVGLHLWLPVAMEGPTPVSALIHAATLVTAGVFLIVRCSPLFEFSPNVLFIILLVGGLTAFFSATVAVTQDDIKRVIAFSTCSQLGYMIFICGLSAYNASLFHLINHAFFKALLFLGSGSIIHSILGNQDMRRFGCLIKFIPYTYSVMLIGFFALAGFPFLSGFYSKDLILELAFSKYAVVGLFSYWLGSMAAVLTAFYSFRVLYFTFWVKVNSFKYYVQNLAELPQTMGLALFLLFLGSLFSGFFLKDAFVGTGNIFWGNSIYQLDFYHVGLDYEFIPFWIKIIPLVFSTIGIILAIYWNLLWDNLQYFSRVLGRFFLGWSILWKDKYYSYPIVSVELYRFCNYEWCFDVVYNYYIGYTVLEHSYKSFYKLLDKSFIELLGPQGFSAIVIFISKKLSHKQLAYLYHSSCLLVWNLILLVCFLWFF
jgi:proton-translocating NADH-quinone oxidoreductase chain L